MEMRGTVTGDGLRHFAHHPTAIETTIAGLRSKVKVRAFRRAGAAFQTP